ncbi:hypothetical protein [Luteibacter rhizovicinus]|nr:hypothetical protein [Luteibacter rhizovicinus]
MSRLDRALHLFSHHIIHNESPSACVRWTANIVNVWLRTAASVGVPHMARQAVAYALESGIGNRSLSLATRTAMGGAAGALPVVMAGGGLLRDYRNGTTTRASIVSRIVAMLNGAIIVAMAGVTGALPSVTASVVALQLYCLLRDIIQLQLTAPDNTHGVSGRALGAAAGAYGSIQMGASAAGDWFAYPSGASASGSTYPWRNDLIRTALAQLAALLDHVTFRGMQRFEEGIASQGEDHDGLRIRLRYVPPTVARISQAATGVITARIGLQTSGALAAATAAHALAGSNLSGTFQQDLARLIGAAVLGAGYATYVGQTIRSDNVYHVDNVHAELGLPASDPAFANMDTPRFTTSFAMVDETRHPTR